MTEEQQAEEPTKLRRKIGDLSEIDERYVYLGEFNDGVSFGGPFAAMFGSSVDLLVCSRCASVVVDGKPNITAHNEYHEAIAYMAERMSQQVIAGNGMCGAPSPSEPPEYCALKAGHAGWHEGSRSFTDDFTPIDPVRWSPERKIDNEESPADGRDHSSSQ